MTVAVRRLARGEMAAVKPRTLAFIVAGVYGQPPLAVLDWPADVMYEAAAHIPAIAGVTRGHD